MSVPLVGGLITDDIVYISSILFKILYSGGEFWFRRGYRVMGLRTVFPEYTLMNWEQKYNWRI